MIESGFVEIKAVLNALRLSLKKAHSELEIIAHISAQEPEFWPKVAKYLIRANELLQVCDIFVGFLENEFERVVETAEEIAEKIEFIYEEYLEFQEALPDLFENDDIDSFGS